MFKRLWLSWYLCVRNSVFIMRNWFAMIENKCWNYEKYISMFSEYHYQADLKDLSHVFLGKYFAAWFRKTKCVVMITTEGSTKIITFMTPRAGVLVCLFVWCFSSHSRTFISFGDWLKICTYALMAIVQSGFFSVPHLLWHGASVYNGHLRGPMTLSPYAERLAVEL